MKYYAHSAEDIPEREWQLLSSHLRHTAELASIFAAKFGAMSHGEIVGYLHDIGKYSSEFQERIRGGRFQVDHSTAGAQEAMAVYGSALGQILAYIVAGHHAGLPDYGSLADEDSLCRRLQKKVAYYLAYKNEIPLLPSSSQLPIKPLPKALGFSLQFYIRLLYSCLVDADYLDTESALDLVRANARGKYEQLETLLDRLEVHLTRIKQNAPIGASVRLQPGPDGPFAVTGLSGDVRNAHPVLTHLFYVQNFHIPNQC